MSFQKGNTLWLGRKHSEETKRKMSGGGNWRWRGERLIQKEGYIFILDRNHPYADISGRVKEERLMIEKHLGRYLFLGEVVHHKNGNKQDNRIENLEVFSSKSEHTAFHNKNVSEKTREKIRKTLKGRILSEVTKQKIREASIGRICSEETRQKLRKSNIGKPRSKEARIKMSQSARLSWIRRKEVI